MSEAPGFEKLNSPNHRVVLVIDDEEAFCDVVCEILDSIGYHPMHAYNAAQAIRQLEVRTPDIILSDIMMPDVDGLTFIRHLRAEPRWAQIPIIVVSAKATLADQDAAADAGADGYLIKPFSSKDLEAVISRTLFRS
jgi:two-component system phosphate regulon response regulator PhoB